MRRPTLAVLREVLVHLRLQVGQHRRRVPLKLDTRALRAVQMEKTPVLPDLGTVAASSQ